MRSTDATRIRSWVRIQKRSALIAATTCSATSEGDAGLDAGAQEHVDQLRDRRVDGLGLLVHQIGLDEARAQDARAHRRAQCELEEEALAESDHGVLRGEVRGDARRRAEAGHRCGVDDVADALLLHDRQRGTDPVDDTEQIDVDHPAPEVHRIGPRITDATDPRVVEHDVHRPELLEGVLDERVHLGLGGGVADHRGDRCAVLGQASLDVAQLRRVDVGEEHAHALVRSAPRRRRVRCRWRLP
jgi:hypothetical protein